MGKVNRVLMLFAVLAFTQSSPVLAGAEADEKAIKAVVEQFRLSLINTKSIN
ncbi:MAG: hypothetical protein ACI9FJ_001106 [Alteromonadaceae bacterium]|jgi:hypothetical protein